MSLDDVRCYADVEDVNGATKLLALKFAEISRREDARHLPVAGLPIVRKETYIQRERALEESLVSYRDMKTALVRDYGIDASGFDAAVRHILPRYYWVFTE